MIFTLISKGKPFHVIIDDERAFEVLQHTWWVKPNGYIYTQKGRETIYLHRLIMCAEKGQEIDHINRDPLDNRECNLRVCTRSQNNMNKRGVRGVSRFRKGWRARIKKDKKEIHLGLYKTKSEAIAARSRAEKVLFGNFANHE